MAIYNGNEFILWAQQDTDKTASLAVYGTLETDAECLMVFVQNGPSITIGVEEDGSLYVSVSQCKDPTKIIEYSESGDKTILRGCDTSSGDAK